jgi:UPF0271 protein
MTTPFTIDLNADVGEHPTRLNDGSEAELMKYLSSANVACGGHAGDEHTMRATVELAIRNGVAVGAHPSYPDRKNFGRTAMEISLGDLRDSIRSQIESLAAIAIELGTRLHHVKPHGALYHSANSNPEVARVIAESILAVNRGLIAVGQAGSPCLATYEQAGLAVAGEAFADRAYESDGKLRDRKLPGALLETPEHAARQAVTIARYGKIELSDGSFLTLSAETLCIHSDTPGSTQIAGAVRNALQANQVQIRSLIR